MHRSRNSRLAIGFVLAAAFLTLPVRSQTAAQIEGDDVARVGSHLACKCGSCNQSVACQMPGGCGFCKRYKTKIAQMQNVGMSDKQIIDSIVSENPAMLITPPQTWGWVMPFAAVALGLIAIAFFIKRSMGRSQEAPVAASAPSDLYRDRIERDMEKLE